ncbi:MAG: alpha/beta hydrolase [Hyphomonadaceae bacterium]|nr:alpha/beta hydrolase [Hyphomonadaceae bacterium]
MTAPDRHATFVSQRLTLSYAEWGDPNAPPLLLVHGGRDQKRSWDRVAARLATRYRVIAHDLRGHGQSDWVSDGDYGVMDHVFDLASLVETLELESFTLIGHSLGGNITLRYAGLFPDKIERLVAIEGLGPSPNMLAERRAQPVTERLTNWIEQRRSLSSRRPRVMKDLAEAKSRMKAAFQHLPDDLIHHLTETGLNTHPDGTVSWAYDPAGMGRSPSDIPHDEFVHLWTQITCPTWLVYGATSWASNPAKDGRLEPFQNATVSVIEDAGHWLHHDQFDDFMVQLDTFLGS